jgi:hypothetical protein
MDTGEAEGFVNFPVDVSHGGVASQLAGDGIGEDAVGGGDGAYIA